MINMLFNIVGYTFGTIAILLSIHMFWHGFVFRSGGIRSIGYGMKRHFVNQDEANALYPLTVKEVISTLEDFDEDLEVVYQDEGYLLNVEEIVLEPHGDTLVVWIL